MRSSVKNRILVVAPHPDDEVLGCGGTLLRHVAEGDAVEWLILTAMTPDLGYSYERITNRAAEIRSVVSVMGFSQVYQLGIPATQLDLQPMSILIKKIHDILNKSQPEVIYLPFVYDAHSDHKIAFNLLSACVKQFRSPFVKRVYAYETLSETESGLMIDNERFNPNTYVNVEAYFDKKLQALSIYSSELGEFPFPRSKDAVKALAQYRGSQSGFKLAEAFIMLREYF